MKQGQKTTDKYITVLHNVAWDCNLGVRDQYEIKIIQALLLSIADNYVRRCESAFNNNESFLVCRTMQLQIKTSPLV